MSRISEHVKRHRDALRAAGLRPMQIWVPDTQSPMFAEKCRRQSLLLREDSAEAQVLDWIEAASDTQGWEH